MPRFRELMMAVAACCAACGGPASWSYAEHVGVVAAAVDKACFTTGAQSIASNDSVHVIETGAQRAWLARIVAPDETCVRSAGDSGEHGYVIRFEGAAPQAPAFGIAILGGAAPRRVDNAIAADVDGDGHDEFFQSCTSSEGVHFTIWSDRPLTGPRRWHRYYPLGYDVTPTCTPAETDAP